MNWSDTISKRKLWRYVNIKINRAIHHYHVFSVITILFDEILKDLMDDKKINIHNFGTLYFAKTKRRQYFNVILRKFMMCEPHRILRFKLDWKVRKKMTSLIDVEKTFKQKE
jgi:nucleoid DNA-binding protein